MAIMPAPERIQRVPGVCWPASLRYRYSGEDPKVEMLPAWTLASPCMYTHHRFVKVIGV